MTKLFQNTTLLALITLLVGCAHAPAIQADSSLESYYKSSPTPPAGMARVYVLPPMHDTALGNFELASDLVVGAGSEGTTPLCRLEKDMFTAFDVPAGYYYITTKPFLQTVTRPSQLFHLAKGETLFLRGTLNGNGAPYGLLGAVAAAADNAGAPEYDVLDTASGMALIQDRRMEGLVPGITPFAKQEITKQAQIDLSAAAPR